MDDGLGRRHERRLLDGERLHLHVDADEPSGLGFGICFPAVTRNGHLIDG
jgi:hypothetical protein